MDVDVCEPPGEFWQFSKRRFLESLDVDFLTSIKRRKMSF